MNTKEILEIDGAVDRALEGGFSTVALWRWKTGKMQPSMMNAAKLAKVLQYEIKFDNGVFEFWKPKEK